MITLQKDEKRTKVLTENELTPGSPIFERFVPRKPEEVVFTESNYLFIFPDGIGIIERSTTEGKLLVGDGFFDDAIAENFISFGKLKEEKPHLFKEKFELIHVANSSTPVITFLSGNKFFLLYIRKDCTLVQWETKEFKEVLFPKANNRGDIVFSCDEKIYVIDHFTGRYFLAYTEEDERYIISRPPSRDEFGIKDLFYWAPDNRTVAFYRTNNTKVDVYPLITIEDPKPIRSLIDYPMAGESSESVSIGILDVPSKGFCTLSLGSNQGTPPINHKEAYYTALTWSADSSEIYLCELERSQQYFQAKVYSAYSGKIKHFLFSESSDKYVEPDQPFTLVSNSTILFLSQRTGHNHLYKFDMKSNTTTPLTQGDWDVLEVISYDEKAKIVYAYATTSGANNREVLQISINGEPNTFKEIHDTGYYHTFFVDKETGETIDFYEDHLKPGFVHFQNDYILPLRNPYVKEGYEIPNKKFGFFEKDGERIYYSLTLPNNTNGQKVPLLFYVYGGPHVQLVTNQFGSGTKGIEEMMASNGIATFYIDPHGSYNRGRNFESVIYQQMNRPQVEDYDYAIDWLQENFGDKVDTSKMAVYGWSFGGYMTLTMLLRSKHTFQIGIAGGAVTDWRYYEVMYTERYMGIRNYGNEKYYEACSIKSDFSKLHTPLYLIHCDNDPVVVWQHTLSLLKIAHEKYDFAHLIDYYIFPGHPHNVKGPERIQLMRKIKAVILNKLK